MKLNHKSSEQLKRLDLHGEVKKKILPLCRLQKGEIWEDPLHGHRVGVLDATKKDDINLIMRNDRASLVINDPPYNVKVGNRDTANLFKIPLEDYMDFSRKWIRNAVDVMDEHAHLYIWTGADYKDNFQPLPDLMILMRDFKKLKPYNFITVRNQRGYGTQRNWMWIRQEFLHYVKGSPSFQVTYTDIPKILKGYYKDVKGKRTENLERSRSKTIRPGNVWTDIQQVFYRMEENVPGCYAQKPLKAIERIMRTSSREGDTVADFFSHSGTALIAGERLKRKVYTFDHDPLFAEITIRRLERFRETGKTGWQWSSPFPEISNKEKRN